MRAIVRFLQIQFRLQKITEEQLRKMSGTTITPEEFRLICGKEGEAVTPNG